MKDLLKLSPGGIDFIPVESPRAIALQESVLEEPHATRDLEEKVWIDRAEKSASRDA